MQNEKYSYSRYNMFVYNHDFEKIDKEIFYEKNYYFFFKNVDEYM